MTNDASTTKSTPALSGLVRSRAEGPCVEAGKGLGDDRPAPVGGTTGVADKGNDLAADCNQAGELLDKLVDAFAAKGWHGHADYIQTMASHLRLYAHQVCARGEA